MWNANNRFQGGYGYPGQPVQPYGAYGYNPSAGGFNSGGYSNYPQAQYNAPVYNGIPVYNGAPYGNGMPAYNSAPYGNGLPAYNGAPYGNGLPAYNGAPYGNGLPAYNGAPYGNGMPAFNGMQGYNGVRYSGDGNPGGNIPQGYGGAPVSGGAPAGSFPGTNVPFLNMGTMFPSSPRAGLYANPNEQGSIVPFNPIPGGGFGSMPYGSFFKPGQPINGLSPSVFESVYGNARATWEDATNDSLGYKANKGYNVYGLYANATAVPQYSPPGGALPDSHLPVWNYEGMANTYGAQALGLQRPLGITPQGADLFGSNLGGGGLASPAYIDQAVTNLVNNMGGKPALDSLTENIGMGNINSLGALQSNRSASGANIIGHDSMDDTIAKMMADMNRQSQAFQNGGQSGMGGGGYQNAQTRNTYGRDGMDDTIANMMSGFNRQSQALQSGGSGGYGNYQNAQTQNTYGRDGMDDTIAGMMSGFSRQAQSYSQNRGGDVSPFRDSYSDNTSPNFNINPNASPDERRKAAINWAHSKVGVNESQNPDQVRSFSQGRWESWCADFVSTAFEKTGGSPWGHLSRVTDIANWAKKHGRWSNTPKAGDAVVYSDGSKEYTHIGLVKSVNADGTITTIGGNESDAVRERTRNLSSNYIKGFVAV